MSLNFWLETPIMWRNELVIVNILLPVEWSLDVLHGHTSFKEIKLKDELGLIPFQVESEDYAE